MGFRFRYLGPEGGEVDVESLDGLRALMESGTVGELTLLYDVLTGEWAPARAHAVFRLLREEKGHEGDGELPDLGLTVSFQASATEPDAERAIRAFLREREEDGSAPQGIESFLSPSVWASASLPPPKEVVSPPRGSSPAARPARATPDPAPNAPIPARAAHRDRPQRGLHHIVARIRRIVGHRWLPPTLILAGSLGLLLVLVMAGGKSSDTASPPDASRAETAAAAAAGPDLGRLVARFALAKASGFKSMVAGMDSLRRAHDVMEVPPVWLGGVYLSDAVWYPEVEGFWRRYQAFLQEVQASDTALFRGGFVRDVAGERLSDALLSMRLNRALREFKDTQPERAALYSEMEELAGAALALHGLLVERADDIDYDPAIQVGISREPVVEAVAEDAVLRDQMWTLLDRIFASLDELGGDLGGSRDNLTDMLLQRVEASSR